MNQYHVPRGTKTQAEYFNYVTGLPWVINSGSLSVHPGDGMVEVDGTIDTDGTDITFLGTVQSAVVPVVITKLQFVNRFTDAEMGAILTAAKSDVRVEGFVFRLGTVTDVQLTDPLTITGVQALEAFGLIGVGRAAVILAH